MRVLYASERPPYPFFLGGAARCAHRVLWTLSREHEVPCRAVGSARYEGARWGFPSEEDYTALDVRAADAQKHAVDCGYPVRLLEDFARELGALMDEFRPDVVWAQLEGARAVLELAAGKGIRGVCYVHDAEEKPEALRDLAATDALFLCSSRFLADRVKRLTGRPAHVVYPAPELFFATSCERNGFITMINPHRVKGIDTFLAIAQRLPKERFLLVESWPLSSDARRDLGERLRAVPNVTFSPRVSDMASVYGKTKLLLVPSVWEEGFGMVALEAQSCRIPVIASRRGGLPEAVGDGGLLVADYLDVEAWLRAIGEALGDYDRLAQRAAAHAASEMFTARAAAARFLEACRPAPRRFSGLRRVLTSLGR